MIYNIYNKDCLEMLKSAPNDSIDLIYVDPPYEISSISGGGTINNVKKLNKSLEQLEKNDIVNGYDIELFGKEFIRICKGVNIYLWCNKAQIPQYLDFYVTQNKCTFDILRWEKTNALPTYSNKYLSDTEFCLYFRKGGNKCKPQCYEDAKQYYIAPINLKDKKKYGHPTIKPLEIVRRHIRNSSSEGDVVLDCFMGSGTTGVACKLENRNFIGIEINKEWFEVAKGRIESGE